jgi:hypothetical protein
MGRVVSGGGGVFADRFQGGRGSAALLRRRGTTTNGVWINRRPPVLQATSGVAAADG